jgi:hypothetical protein
MMDARSVADVPEHELVELLVNDHLLRSMILSATGSNSATRMHLRVPSSELAPDRNELGDVDLLVYDETTPHLAAAYEFKRVKVTRDAFYTGSPNKLAQISKAIQQANALERMGFNRVALAIVVVTDGRERVEFNFAFRGASHALLRTVDSAIDLSGLHADVGACRFEVVQPIDRDFTLSGGISAKALRIPRARGQRPELSERIELYHSRTTAG